MFFVPKAVEGPRVYFELELHQNRRCVFFFIVQTIEGFLVKKGLIFKTSYEHLVPLYCLNIHVDVTGAVDKTLKRLCTGSYYLQKTFSISRNIGTDI